MRTHEGKRYARVHLTADRPHFHVSADLAEKSDLLAEVFAWFRRQEHELAVKRGLVVGWKYRGSTTQIHTVCPNCITSTTDGRAYPLFAPSREVPSLTTARLHCDVCGTDFDADLSRKWY